MLIFEWIKDVKILGGVIKIVVKGLKDIFCMGRKGEFFLFIKVVG